jgi:hypothetical protein
MPTASEKRHVIRPAPNHSSIVIGKIARRRRFQLRPTAFGRLGQAIPGLVTRLAVASSTNLFDALEEDVRPFVEGCPLYILRSAAAQSY